MVITELHIVNIPAAVFITSQEAYVMEGVLWISDDDGELISGYPLHTLSHFKFSQVEEGEQDDKA